MADDTLKNNLRRSILQAGGPRMLSAVARHRGWPSAQALEFAIATGAKLNQGGAITSADVDAAARHYPNIPRHVLNAYAGRINAAEPGTARRDALVRNFGIGGADAHIVREIETYAVHDVARAVDARASERERERAPEPDRDHPTYRHNADAAQRRALLERQLPEPREFSPNANHREVRHALANRIEADADLYDRAEALGANSRKDDIAYAYDKTHSMEQVEAVLGVEDLVEPLAEATATTGDNPT